VSLARFARALLGAGLLAGCPTVTNDPPPPPTKPEIVPAPPRALGAMAAGTDAAPRPDRTPGAELMPSLPLPPGGGLVPAPDAGAPAPGGPGPGGLAPAPPDAGMAL
jgi:hypothetical protein